MNKDSLISKDEYIKNITNKIMTKLLENFFRSIYSIVITSCFLLFFLKNFFIFLYFFHYTNYI